MTRPFSWSDVSFFATPHLFLAQPSVYIQQVAKGASNGHTPYQLPVPPSSSKYPLLHQPILILSPFLLGHRTEALTTRLQPPFQPFHLEGRDCESVSLVGRQLGEGPWLGNKGGAFPRWQLLPHPANLRQKLGDPEGFFSLQQAPADGLSQQVQDPIRTSWPINQAIFLQTNQSQIRKGKLSRDPSPQ